MFCSQLQPISPQLFSLGRVYPPRVNAPSIGKRGLGGIGRPLRLAFVALRRERQSDSRSIIGRPNEFDASGFEYRLD
jgi:hypothetical protein